MLLMGLRCITVTDMLDSMKQPDRIGTRVNLTLPDEVVAVIDRMGAVTGMGRATVVRQWMEAASPAMLEVAKGLELAQENNLDAYLLLANQIGSIAQDAGQISLDLKNTRRRLMRKKKRD